MEDKFYRCPICGNVFGVIHDAGVTPVCCGKPMETIKANSTEAATEKHIPVVTIENGICTVKVGEVAHPMLDEHYIDWIMVHTNKGRHRFVLKPHEAPEVKLHLGENEEVLRVFANCNLHGLWVKEVK